MAATTKSKKEEAQYEFLKYIAQTPNNYAFATEQIKAALMGLQIRSPFSYERELGTIRRCFYPNDINEIIERLKMEQTEFATQCVNIIESSSPLAMKLTLKILRESLKKNFVETSILELSAALNRVCDKEFPNALQAKLSSSNQQNIYWKYDSFKAISDDQIQSYLKPPKWLTPKSLHTVENAFLPNKEFYGFFPDCMRMWLNNESVINQGTRRNFQNDMEEAFKSFGIDQRDSGITSKALREEFRNEYEIDRVTSEIGRRARDICDDPILLEKYIKDRQELIDEFCKSEKQYTEKIEKQIENAFEKVI